METLIGIVGVIVCIGIAVGINYLKGEYGGAPARKAKEKEEERKKRKPISEMTPEEKAKNLRVVEEMYKHGKLTFLEYDTLKAAYTDTKSFADEYGMEFTKAASDKLAADKAVEKHKEETEKRIITNSAIGSAIGGVAGGIAGAVSAASKASVETEQLLAEQEKANKQYEEALKKSIK